MSDVKIEFESGTSFKGHINNQGTSYANGKLTTLGHRTLEVDF